MTQDNISTITTTTTSSTISSSPRYPQESSSTYHHNVGVDDVDEEEEGEEEEEENENKYTNPYLNGYPTASSVEGDEEEGDGDGEQQLQQQQQREIISGLDYYNEVAEPSHIYAYRALETKRQRFLEQTLDICFDTLPVDLTPLMDILDGTTYLPVYSEGEREGEEEEGDVIEVFLSHPNLLERLIVTLFNEEDRRIANKETKYQVLEILHSVIAYGGESSPYKGQVTIEKLRRARIRMRIAIQSVKPHTWLDEIEPEDPDVFKDMEEDMIVQMKLLFFKCWKVDPNIVKPLLENSPHYYSLTETCRMILQYYAAMQLQSTIRGYNDRNRQRKALALAAEAQGEEVRQWSVLLIQKIARGYIARKTVVRSMKIRKQLSREVLRIAEKYMTSGSNSSNGSGSSGEKSGGPDLWGFLQEINEELNRLKAELHEKDAREDNWASTFVDRVLVERQKEFNEAWDRFPRVLKREIEKNANKRGDPVVGVLVDKTSDFGKAAKTLKAKGGTSSGTTSSTGSLKGKTSSLNVTSKKKTSTAASAAGTITVEEVTREITRKNQGGIAAGGPALPPGPLIRKALEKTVTAEVTDQLNYLMSSAFHSKKLANDIQSVYGPESDPIAMAKKGQSAGAKGAGSTGGKVLPPIKKKTTKSLDGKVVKLVGKISATHRDWVNEASAASSSSTGGSLKGKSSTSRPSSSPAPASTMTATEDTFNVVVQPGNSLLLDIPRGFEDSVERLMHAAALRCYVPDFFRGPSSSSGDNETNGTGSIEQSVEEDLASLSSLERKRLKREREEALQQSQSRNHSADYAYQVYLSMPMGLAKMRYELECKKYSQVYINRLRVKGIHFIANDCKPLSKFVMCLKSVETPSVLIQKCVDLYVELKKISSVANGMRVGVDATAGSGSSSKTGWKGGKNNATVQEKVKGKQQEETTVEDEDRFVDTTDGTIYEHSSITKQRQDREKKRERERLIREKEKEMKEREQRKKLQEQQQQTGVYQEDSLSLGKGTVNESLMSLPTFDAGDGEGIVEGEGSVSALGDGESYLDDHMEGESNTEGEGDNGEGETFGEFESQTALSGTSALSNTSETAKRNQDKHEQRRLGKKKISFAADSSLLSTSIEGGGIPSPSSSVKYYDPSHPPIVLATTSASPTVYSATSVVSGSSLSLGGGDTYQTSGGSQSSASSASSSSSTLPPPSLVAEANRLLQAMLENTDSSNTGSDWCRLEASVEEIFIQAAFLIVPHRSTKFDSTKHDDEERERQLDLTGDKGRGKAIPASIFNRDGSIVEGNEEEKEKEKEEKLMGNHAFKYYAMELLSLSPPFAPSLPVQSHSNDNDEEAVALYNKQQREREQQKEDLVRSRFRASVILTTPYTLYLKSKGILTVKDLLSIELTDLALPKPLFTQLEVLLTIVINQRVRSRLLPIPRSLESLRSDDYLVPMYYDTKFQRTPLDVKGKVPALPPGWDKEKGGNTSGTSSNSSAGDKRSTSAESATGKGGLKTLSSIKKHLKRLDRKETSYWKSIQDIHRLPTSGGNVANAAIEQDLDDSRISLWQSVVAPTTSNVSPLTLPMSSAASTIGSSTSNGGMDEKWSFTLSSNDDHAIPFHGTAPGTASGTGTSIGHKKNSGANTGTGGGRAGERKQKIKTMNGEDLEVTIVDDDNDSDETGTYDTGASSSSPSTVPHRKPLFTRPPGQPQSSIASPPPNGKLPSIARPPPQQPAPLAHRDFVTENLTPYHPVFKESYCCHFPNCGQIFSRNYTYKVHLKTHEMFPQYHEFKRKPQIGFDSL